jgi:hypothetical protein
MTRRALLAAVGLPGRILAVKRFLLTNNAQASQVMRYLETMPGARIDLEAIQAPHVPQILSIGSFVACDRDTQLVVGRIETVPARGQFLEFRSWHFETLYQPMTGLLSRHGLRPLFNAGTLQGRGFVSLIPFETMAARARAWDALAADQEWIRLRQECRGSVSGIALYRAL